MTTEEKGIIRPITRSRTLGRVAIYAGLVGVYSVIPAWKDNSNIESVHDFADLPPEIHAALTLVLGWLLVFRTNTAYSRWWEARTLWGALVNTSRNLSAKFSCLTTLAADDIDELRRCNIAFPYALKNHLRADYPAQDVPGLGEGEFEGQHIPAALTARMYERMRGAKSRGDIDGDELRVIDNDLRRLLDICGGCERIYKTRVARSYRVFARQCVVLYLATLPWGISNDFSWWTIPLTIIVSYFMIGLETVAEHVEEPFGFDEDDLDLDGLCDTMRRSTEQIMGPAAFE